MDPYLRVFTSYSRQEGDASGPKHITRSKKVKADNFRVQKDRENLLLKNRKYIQELQKFHINEYLSMTSFKVLLERIKKKKNSLAK